MNAAVTTRFLQKSNQMLLILPIGSYEQHGPYLPLDTDLRIASLLAEQLAKTFPPDRVLLLPALPYSCSWEHKGPGTLALTVGTLAAVIHDLAQSLKTWQFPALLLLVNWHGGNDLLGALATEITARDDIPTAAIPSVSQVGQFWEQSGITAAKDIHAGAVETSVIQAYWPELLPHAIPETAHDEPQIEAAKVQPVLQALGSSAVTREGIWGAPEQADASKGRQLIESLVSSMYEQVAALLTLVETSSKKRGGV